MSTNQSPSPQFLPACAKYQLQPLALRGGLTAVQLRASLIAEFLHAAYPTIDTFQAVDIQRSILEGGDFSKYFYHSVTSGPRPDLPPFTILHSTSRLTCLVIDADVDPSGYHFATTFTKIQLPTRAETEARRLDPASPSDPNPGLTFLKRYGAQRITRSRR